MHVCGTTRCPSCKEFVEAVNHRCYLRPVASKPPSDRLIFFDFETDQQTGEHIVNLAVAQYKDGKEEVFKGYDSCKKFCFWLFRPIPKGCIVIAHNLKG